MSKSGGVAFAVLLASAASAAFAGEVDRTFEKRFGVEPGARLEIEHGDGDVVVTAWDESAIEVEVRYRAEFTRVGLGTDPDLDVRFEESGNVVRVIGDEKTRVAVGFFSMNEIEHVYRVKAPPWVELDLSGDDGGLEAAGWRAAITAATDDGDVRLEDVKGRVRLRVDDGDVEIAGADGELDVEVDDGDVTLRDCRSERARIDVQDGRLRIEGCEGSFEIFADDGDVRIVDLAGRRVSVRGGDGRVEVDVARALGELDLDVRTDDGDIDLELGAAVSATFTLTSSEGDVRVDAAGALDERRRRANGTLGDGAGRIRASSGSGSVTLRQAE